MCTALPINATLVDKLCYFCFQKPPVVAPRDRTTRSSSVEAMISLSNCPKLLNVDAKLFSTFRERITTQDQRANQRPGGRCQISETTGQLEDILQRETQRGVLKQEDSLSSADEMTNTKAASFQTRRSNGLLNLPIDGNSGKGVQTP